MQLQHRSMLQHDMFLNYITGADPEVHVIAVSSFSKMQSAGSACIEHNKPMHTAKTTGLQHSRNRLKTNLSSSMLNT